MFVDDFDISPSKIGESAQRIVDRALEEARRREHVQLTNEHVFLAFAQVEWDAFAEVMWDLGANPHRVLAVIDDRLIDRERGREFRVADTTKVAFKLAVYHASRAGRLAVQSSDLLSAILEEGTEPLTSILSAFAIVPAVLLSRIQTRMGSEHGIRAYSTGAKEAATTREGATPEEGLFQSLRGFLLHPTRDRTRALIVNVIAATLAGAMLTFVSEGRQRECACSIHQHFDRSYVPRGEVADEEHALDDERGRPLIVKKVGVEREL